MLETIMAHVNPIMPYAMLPLSLVLLALTICHAKVMFNSWKSALLMALSGWFIAFAVEDFAIHLTGFYYFTELMGPKLDVIPFSLPSLWVVYIYSSFIVTNLVLDGSPLPKNYGWPRMLAGTVIGVLILTALDLIADPIAVDNGYWVWVHSGKYFGVPLMNFLCGWFPIGGMTILLHYLQLRRENIPVLEERTRGVQIASLIPVLFYGFFWVFFMVYNFEHILGLAALFAVGIPFAIAVWKWGCWYNYEGYGTTYEVTDKFSEEFIEGINEAREKEE